MTTILFDLEANGLLNAEDDKPEATRSWCISAIDIDHREPRFFGPDEIEAGLAYLATADVLAGHNIQRYDVPLMRKLYGFKWSGVVRDTMIIARTKYPNVRDTDGDLIRAGKMPAGKGYQGKHTIGAWGYRLGLPKLHEDITHWDVYTAEMGERCVGDMWTNLKLWDHLHSGFILPEVVVQLEHDIQLVCDMMQDAGVPFNMKAAAQLHCDLVERRDVLERQLVEQFGSWQEVVKSHGAPVVYKRDNVKKGIKAGDIKYKTVTFNPGSRHHIAKVLFARGWAPLQTHESGNPEIDEAEVERIMRLYPEMAGLGEYLMVGKRLSQLVDGKQSLLNNIGKDGRIHGVINPMGTTTSRAAHFHPNLGQVPSSKKPYGDRFRGLFEVPEGWELVGADMDGLEGRGFAHYMHLVDGGAYMNALLSGDPHWASCIALGFMPEDAVRDKHNRLHIIVREGAKRFYYAFIYGAWLMQCGSIILDTLLDARKEGFTELYAQFFGDSEAPSEALLKRVGGRARDKFMTGVPGMDKLLKKLERQVKKFGWVPGLDGPASLSALCTALSTS